MRNIDWKIECRNLVLLLAIAGISGWFVGLAVVAMLVTSLAYTGWLFLQLRRVSRWLDSGDSSPPPESFGVFGAVLDNIYRLQRKGAEEHRKLRAHIQYLQDSFASLEDGAVMVDENTCISWCNQAAIDMLGLRYPEDHGRQLTNLVRNPAFVVYIDNGDYGESLQIRSPVNNHIDLTIKITFFGEGQRLMLVRDITQANRLQQMRKDFVANVSHELRTPLTVISGYLETLSEHGLRDELSWRRAIDQMLSQSRRMEALIRDLTSLSKLESAPKSAEAEVIEMRPMLEMIREEAHAAVPPDRRVEFSIDCDDGLLLRGNPTEIHSAVTNLVVNAAKYCGNNGNVMIRWYKDRRAAYLEVQDDGQGIEAHHLPRLTERFYRVDKSRSLETGGTGLGLAIVKHVLLHHQAELRIDSAPGKGSTFSCVFPLLRTSVRSCSA